MTSRDFCYWLQGFFELTQVDADVGMTGRQRQLVERHLALVFKHEIDPSAGGPAKQQALQDIHDGGPHPTSNPPRIGGTSPDGKIVYRC